MRPSRQSLYELTKLGGKAKDGYGLNEKVLMKAQSRIRDGVLHSLKGQMGSAGMRLVDAKRFFLPAICISIMWFVRRLKQHIFLPRSKFQFVVTIFSCFIICAYVPSFVFAASPEEKEIKNVLVVNSYHSGYEWSDDIMKGIQSVLGDNNLIVSIEYLDSKRYSDEIYYKYLEEIIRYKYGNAKIDAIIMSDHHAFYLMQRMRKTFQTDVPLIFCGLDRVDPESIAVYKPIYGIVEGDSGIRSTLDLILSIHPGIHKIFFIADGTTSAGVMLKYVRDYEPSYKEIVTFDYLINMSVGELKAALKNVPQNSVVMWLHFIKDKNGKVFTVSESQKYVVNNVSAPVYACYGFNADTGIVGGSINEGFVQGEKAAQIALELLSKNIVPDPFYQQSSSTNMFDYKVMKRFNIGIKDIPENSIIYNKPFADFEKYRWQIIGIIIFVVAQTLLIVSMLISQKKRKHMEENLRESEEKFRSLMEQSPISIQIHSSDGKLVQSNAAYKKLYDFNEETLTELYDKWNILEDEQFRKRGFMPFIERVFAGEEDVVFPIIEYDAMETLENLDVKKPQAKRTWVQARGFPLKDKDGAVEYAVFTAEDITERKQAEDKLKQLRAYTDHLIQTANVMIVSLDTDGRVTHFNPAAEAITGYTISEVKERDWFEVLVPRDQYPEVYEEFNRLIQGGSPRFFENPVVTKDGGERFISWSNSEIREGEEIIGVTSFGIDITERKKAGEALRESEKKFRLLVEQSPFSIQILNTDGHIHQINEAFKRLWGIPEEALPEVLAKYNIFEDEEAIKLGIMPAIRRAFSGEVVILPLIEYDASNTMADLGLAGTEANKRWFQSRFYPVKNSKGKVVNIVNIEEDMTERRETEQKVQEHQQRLKALVSQLTVAEERERRRIAAHLHDHVGQSLALARIQLATACKSKSQDKRNAILEDISESLLQAVQDTREIIYDLSPPQMNEIGLAAAISEWLEEQIEKRYGLKTELIDDGRKKPLDDDMRAILFRNVRELLTNVVKHAYANQVSVSMENTDGFLKIVVQDDGIGFDYDSEFQAVKSESGFGLFSVQERMSDLGGSLEIVSEPGKGCTAILRVPLSEGQG